MAEKVETAQEIYVRFRTQTGAAGIHETACHDIQEAASIFQGDPDCVSAFRIEIDRSGRVISASDVTEPVLQSLLDLYREGEYEGTPHPLVEDAFDARRAAWEREQLDEADHIRAEQSMPQP